MPSVEFPGLPAELLVLPPLFLLACGLLPARLANRHARLLRVGITTLAAIQVALAVFAASLYAASGVAVWRPEFWLLDKWLPASFGIYYDGVAALMLSLVSLVGCIVCKYSIRYLDGEERQGAYFGGIGVTVGAVSLMVLSSNLAMLIAAWVLTSLGLHRLLVHYGQRPVARWAAWTKFAISRLGDVALLGAAVLIYSEFRTLDFATLFSAIQAESYAVTVSLNLAALLLVVGAVTKSAQVPFHTWLPQTLDTPTPVSALMHAGVVNAGGFLVIRMSPLVNEVSWSLGLLAVCGLVTACYAATVMLTQTSVKSSLAYSTIAQMGFMMLQCGLGAYSAAMVHIVAHSLYKAYAFLNSGNVLAERAARRYVASHPVAIAWPKLGLVAALLSGWLWLGFAVVGINLLHKPGGLLLGGILCVSLTTWIMQAMRCGQAALLARSLLIAGGLCVMYVLSFAAVDSLVARSQGLWPATPASLTGSLLVMGAFAGLLMLHFLVLRERQPSWLPALRIHAANGFYFEAAVRRLFGRLASE